MEPMKHVSHEWTRQLFHNKFIVVLGDSIQRSVYKDLVLLLQKDTYLSLNQLKNKGEMSFEKDYLVEGGRLGQMHNGKEYKEVRQYKSDHHLVRFYFVTRIYSSYMKSILEDFQHDLKPDVVIVNSCVWDISRYNSRWVDDYKENLNRFFGELKDVLPEETLIIWNLTMPLGERIKGGFLVPEVEHRAPQLRYDVIEANFYSGTLANAYGMDVLDLHFQFRLSLQHRRGDGVHWSAIAHRRISSLLLQHIAQAWGVIWPNTVTFIEHTGATDQQPARENPPKPTERHTTKTNYTSCKKELYSGSFSAGYAGHRHWPQMYGRQAGEASRRPAPLQPLMTFDRHRYEYRQEPHDFSYRPSHWHAPYVMRNRHNRLHYAPHMDQRTQHNHHDYYYFY